MKPSILHIILAKIALALVVLLLLQTFALAAGLVDPATDPVGYATQTIDFLKSCWPLGVGLVLYGALELVAWLGEDIPSLAFLNNGRITLVIGGATAVMGALLSSFLSSGDLRGALVAAVVALAAFWHPAAKKVGGS